MAGPLSKAVWHKARASPEAIRPTWTHPSGTQFLVRLMASRHWLACSPVAAKGVCWYKRLSKSAEAARRCTRPSSARTQTVPREKYESKGRRRTCHPRPWFGCRHATPDDAPRNWVSQWMSGSPREPGHQGRHPCRHQKREQVVQTVEAKKSRQPHQQNGAFHLP